MDHRRYDAAVRTFRKKPDLSIVVVGYDMARELPRTLMSLSRSYQVDVDDIDYEVLVIDNGSPVPLDDSIVDGLDGRFRFLRIDDAPPSPVHAANLGVSMTTGRFVGLILDGARLVSPGAVRAAMTAALLHPRPVITTMAWHLGPEHQSISIAKGYGPGPEDSLLESIDWPRSGYRLFDVAALAGANPQGMIGEINESCFLVLPRTIWDEVGGLDEAFDIAGGGLVSLDFFIRLMETPDSQLVVLLGEGSFHQVHGGASTKPAVDHTPWHAQYERLRGRPYAKTPVDPLYVGRVPESARRWLTI